MRSNVAVKEEIPRHGFGGMPPIMRDPRDLDGKDKRKESGTQNINVDRLEWLHAHGKITQTQLDAGRKLQGDCELAQIGGFSSVGSVRAVNLVPSNLPDAKLDAMARVNAARGCMHPSAWRLVEFVVVANIQLAEAAKRLWGRNERGVATFAIQFALHALACHYGLDSRVTSELPISPNLPIRA